MTTFSGFTVLYIHSATLMKIMDDSLFRSTFHTPKFGDNVMMGQAQWIREAKLVMYEEPRAVQGTIYFF